MNTASEHTDDDTADTLPPPAPLPRPRETPRVRVLLVEPAPIIRIFIMRALVIHGYDVECASSLAEVEEALRRDPALVLAELHLADGSGDTVCNLVRDRLGAGVPVVLMSSGPEKELVRRGARCEAHRCFSKQLGLNALLPLVHELALECESERPPR